MRYAAAYAWAMSFLSCGWLTVVHSQLVMSVTSLVEPPSKYLSPLPLTASLTNTVSNAASLSLNTAFQSSPAAPPFSTLPSSSNRPSSWTASTLAGAAKVMYCSRSEHTNSADQKSTRLLRAPSPIE